jgi:hypothetical protein
MNYQRIYAAFIDDRKDRQPSAPAYFEKHHILPRSLGGDDEASNIIRLTPEDHFFAHLLLAKMHGGTLWAPIAFMVGGSRKDYRPTHSRRQHGWASRAMAKATAATGAHQFDFTERKLRHKDGREWSGTQWDMHKVLGLSKSLANMLIKGGVKSAHGWSLGDAYVPKPRGRLHPMYRHEVHRFVHADGREFVGTQHELHTVCGLSKPAACNLARGVFKVSHGWRLKAGEAVDAS